MSSSSRIAVGASAWVFLGTGPLLAIIASASGVVMIREADAQPSAPDIPHAIIATTGPNFYRCAESVGVWALVSSGGTASIDVTIGLAAAAVSQSGSAGADYSANKPTLPNIGANFAASGPYASYVLIATVPANPSRNNLDIENTAGAQIVVIRDDGTAASAAAPANASVFALAGGSSAGAQGGSWASQTFKGRVQVYAASSTAQVAIFVD